MAAEIERKFLVRDDAWQAQAADVSNIVQGYLLAREDVQLRVRMVETARHEKQALVALKTSTRDVRVREEIECSVPLAIGKALMSLSRYRVSKTRHRVPFGGRVWEVDVYHGFLRGLTTAEVELERADAEVILPPWAGEEVTGSALYSNAHLSRQGLPPALRVGPAQAARGTRPA